MRNFDTNEFEMAIDEFDGMSGEEMYEAMLGKVDKVRDGYISYYAKFLEVMHKLSASSMNLLLWMAFNSEMNTGRVFIQSFALRDALKELGIVIATYYKALKELKSLGVIKGTNAVYYINPAYVWKGTTEMRNRFMRVYPRLK